MKPIAFILFIALLPSVFACRREQLPPPLPAAARDSLIHHYSQLYKRQHDTLARLHYQAIRDTLNGVSYARDQVVFWYDQNTDTATVHNQMKAEYGDRMKVIKRCGCSDGIGLEVWSIDGIDTIGVNETGSSGTNKAASTVGKEWEENLEENIFYYHSMPTGGRTKGGSVDTSRVTVKPSSRPETPVIIAVLDTGLDFRYNREERKDKEPRVALWQAQPGQDARFCLPEPMISGWDFVNNDNNPWDDNAHGTHVAGIIADHLAEAGINYQLMILKTLDHNGVGTTADAACAVLLATEMGAEVINASWGFYGRQNKMLRKAFEYAADRGVITVNSAGNDWADLAFIPHQPSVFATKGDDRVQGMIFVSALRNDGRQLLPGSNFRTEGQHADGFIALPGDSVVSLIPHHLQDTIPNHKSGTSVAAPVMTALVATYIARLRRDTTNGQIEKVGPAKRRNRDQAVIVRNALINMIRDEIKPRRFRMYGNQYPYYALDYRRGRALIDSAAKKKRKNR